MRNTPDGHQRRDEALSLLEQNRAHTILRARRAFLELLLRSADGTATVEQVRTLIALPTALKPQWLGAVPAGLKGPAGIIEFDRYELASRPEAHARPLARWRLVSRRKAQEWLAEHPDPETPPPRIGQQFLLKLGEGT